LVVYRG